MARLTVTDAARVTGVSRVTLHRAIKAGKLRQGPDGKIDTADLSTAGFSLHPDTLSSMLQDDTTTRHTVTPVTPVTPQAIDYQERYIEELHRQVRRLEKHVDALEDEKRQLQEAQHQKEHRIQEYETQMFQMLQEAQQTVYQQQQRLLTMGQGSAAPVAAVPRDSTTTLTADRGDMRRRIEALVREHPEGLSPSQVRRLLDVQKPLANTMAGMARDGLLQRRDVGCYTVPGQ